MSNLSVLQDLRSFQQWGSVLYVAAHPDDENTQLIAYLARARGYRTAYLSITRGDGGQNVLGSQFGEELGVIRTQELLAARRIDSGRQFFTRAIDFGFSKDYQETLRIWDRQQVLGDVVRVIRAFRPDVIITRFSPQPGGTHGHHTASAVLALEAFKLAGDPKAFPEQLEQLSTWQPKRIFLNGFGGGPGRVQGQESGSNTNLLRLDANADDPVSGEPLSALAGRSRSMHKTQGFGNFTGPGNRGPRIETFQLMDGEPATKDILDGVDTSWNRLPGGVETGLLAQQITDRFDTNNPEASVPELLAMRARLNSLLAKDPILEEKRALLDHILQSCLGLSVRTTVNNNEVVPGETLKMHHTASVNSKIPVVWRGLRYPSLRRDVLKPIPLRPAELKSRDDAQVLPAGTPLSQPYWLRQEHPPGMYHVDDPNWIGCPENPSAFPIEQIFEVGGQTLTLPDEPIEVASVAGGNKVARHLNVISPVSMSFISNVRLFAPGSSRSVEVELAAWRPNSKGTLELEMPPEWKATPASKSFHLHKPGERSRISFVVTAPPLSTNTAIRALARIRRAQFGSERVELQFDHIPRQLLQPAARLEVVSLDMAIRGKKVGYLPGAGDDVAECVHEMGYDVSQLSGEDLTTERLRGLDAVVIGVRAFNVRTDLATHLSALFSYVESGGNVIVQYNRPNDLKSKLAPYELRLSGERVTDENSPISFLAPNHPALTTPNTIMKADFDGWVQERGLYFPNEWDEHFVPILECNDPGESPKKGSLLVTQYGRGYFVYTGLAWFRQLPAGVPGAYRLFANLISLGK